MDVLDAPRISEHPDVPTIFLVDRTGEIQVFPERRDVDWSTIAPHVQGLLEVSDEVSPEPRFIDDRRSLRVLPINRSLFAVIIETRARNLVSTFARRYRLTRRESQVASCVVEGMSTSEIADRLAIAPATVVLHVKRVLAKTGSRTRVDFVGLAAGLHY
jgi:DNA-binding CsgD family transcriptional regulator